MRISPVNYGYTNNKKVNNKPGFGVKFPAIEVVKLSKGLFHGAKFHDFLNMMIHDNPAKAIEKLTLSGGDNPVLTIGKISDAQTAWVDMTTGDVFPDGGVIRTAELVLRPSGLNRDAVVTGNFKCSSKKPVHRVTDRIYAAVKNLTRQLVDDPKYLAEEAVEVERAIAQAGGAVRFFNLDNLNNALRRGDALSEIVGYNPDVKPSYYPLYPGQRDRVLADLKELAPKFAKIKAADGRTTTATIADTLFYVDGFAHLKVNAFDKEKLVSLKPTFLEDFLDLASLNEPSCTKSKNIANRILKAVKTLAKEAKSSLAANS